MYTLFDAHCDTITELKDGKGSGSLFKSGIHLDIERLREYNSPIQIFALWIKPKFLNISFEKTREYINFYFNEIKKYEEFINHANSYKDIIENREKGKISGMLSIEGGEALLGDINNLYILREMGVSSVTITWNFKNELGCGAMPFVKNPETGKYAKGYTEEVDEREGLTTFGKEVIKEMNRLEMLIDVSHLNESGFWDVYRNSKKPFIASHSNAKSICDVPRNLTDNQIKAIAEKGGVIGICFYPGFIGGTCDIPAIMKHIDHIIKLAGEDAIGIGADFDGIETTPEDLKDVSYTKKLIFAVEKEYGERIARKFAEENFMRVIKNI